MYIIDERLREQQIYLNLFIHIPMTYPIDTPLSARKKPPLFASPIHSKITDKKKDFKRNQRREKQNRQNVTFDTG